MRRILALVVAALLATAPSYAAGTVTVPAATAADATRPAVVSVFTLYDALVNPVATVYDFLRLGALIEPGLAESGGVAAMVGPPVAPVLHRPDVDRVAHGVLGQPYGGKLLPADPDGAHPWPDGLYFDGLHGDEFF